MEFFKIGLSYDNRRIKLHAMHNFLARQRIWRLWQKCADYWIPERTLRESFWSVLWVERLLWFFSISSLWLLHLFSVINSFLYEMLPRCGNTIVKNANLRKKLLKRKNNTIYERIVHSVRNELHAYTKCEAVGIIWNEYNTLHWLEWSEARAWSVDQWFYYWNYCVASAKGAQLMCVEWCEYWSHFPITAVFLNFISSECEYFVRLIEVELVKFWGKLFELAGFFDKLRTFL